MSKTLEELRTWLGRDTALLIEGTATVNVVTNQLIDTNGLARFTKDSALNGGLLYILAAGSATPEDESRFITAYTAASQIVTVEYAFGAAPTTGDTYEIYRVPLTLDQWDQCINRAILDAWPEVWRLRVQEIDVTGAHWYALNTDADAVHKIHIETWDGDWPRSEKQELHRGIHWDTYQSSDGSARLYMLRPVAARTYAGTTRLFVYFRDRFDELAAAGSTLLDPAYIKASAAAHLYRLLADDTRGQADRSAYLQLLNYWREQAQEQKRKLVAALPQINIPALTQTGGKKRG